MGLFDKLFNNEKNGFDKALEKAFNDFTENNPITRQAKAKINEAADLMSESLETELYGEPKGGTRPSVMDSFDERRREWDSLIDQIAAKELSKYKICPSCGEEVPANYETCPYCNTKLPEYTAEVRVCPHCGAKNKTLNFYCENCGKEMHVFHEENKA